MGLRPSAGRAVVTAQGSGGASSKTRPAREKRGRESLLDAATDEMAEKQKKKNDGKQEPVGKRKKKKYHAGLLQGYAFLKGGNKGTGKNQSREVSLERERGKKSRKGAEGSISKFG